MDQDSRGRTQHRIEHIYANKETVVTANVRTHDGCEFFQQHKLKRKKSLLVMFSTATLKNLAFASISCQMKRPMITDA